MLSLRQSIALTADNGLFCSLKMIQEQIDIMSKKMVRSKGHLIQNISGLKEYSCDVHITWPIKLNVNLNIRHHACPTTTLYGYNLTDKLSTRMHAIIMGSI
jgi:hypothetical protein